jgi:hypothetical protein
MTYCYLLLLTMPPSSYTLGMTIQLSSHSFHNHLSSLIRPDLTANQRFSRPRSIQNTDSRPPRSPSAPGCASPDVPQRPCPLRASGGACACLHIHKSMSPHHQSKKDGRNGRELVDVRSIVWSCNSLPGLPIGPDWSACSRQPKPSEATQSTCLDVGFCFALSSDVSDSLKSGDQGKNHGARMHSTATQRLTASCSFHPGAWSLCGADESCVPERLRDFSFWRSCHDPVRQDADKEDTTGWISEWRRKGEAGNGDTMDGGNMG